MATRTQTKAERVESLLAQEESAELKLRSAFDFLASCEKTENAESIKDAQLGVKKAESGLKRVRTMLHKASESLREESRAQEAMERASEQMQDAESQGAERKDVKVQSRILSVPAESLSEDADSVQHGESFAQQFSGMKMPQGESLSKEDAEILARRIRIEFPAIVSYRMRERTQEERDAAFALAQRTKKEGKKREASILLPVPERVGSESLFTVQGIARFKGKAEHYGVMLSFPNGKRVAIRNFKHWQGYKKRFLPMLSDAAVQGMQERVVRFAQEASHRSAKRYRDIQDDLGQEFFLYLHPFILRYVAAIGNREMTEQDAIRLLAGKLGYASRWNCSIIWRLRIRQYTAEESGMESLDRSTDGTRGGSLSADGIGMTLADLLENKDALSPMGCFLLREDAEKMRRLLPMLSAQERDYIAQRMEGKGKAESYKEAYGESYSWSRMRNAELSILSQMQELGMDTEGAESLVTRAQLNTHQRVKAQEAERCEKESRIRTWQEFRKEHGIALLPAESAEQFDAMLARSEMRANASNAADNAESHVTRYANARSKGKDSSFLRERAMKHLENAASLLRDADMLSEQWLTEQKGKLSIESLPADIRMGSATGKPKRASNAGASARISGTGRSKNKR